MALQNKTQQHRKIVAHWLGKILLTVSVLCPACAISPPSKATVPTAKASWQMNQIQTTTDLNLPINYPQAAEEIKIIVKLDPLQLERGDIKSSPEHYVTVVISCAGSQIPIKTSTFAPYPLGSEGTFILVLPQTHLCFKPAVKTVALSVKLHLQLSNPDTPLTLRGEILLEQH